MENIELNVLAKAITKAGIILMENGAETSRVEDTMQRLAFAYGASVCDSYATPTLLIISFSLGGDLIHNVKRVHTKTTNLSKIDEVNSLSRQIALKAIPLDEFNKKLDEIDAKEHPDITKLLGAAISTFGFAFFFNGTIIDAITAVLFGVITYKIWTKITQIDVASFIEYTVSSFVLTALSLLFAPIFGANKHIVIVSIIMLLVPGLAITNAIKDTVSGDLVSGLTRAAEAIFVAVAIALGSAIAYMILGGF